MATESDAGLPQLLIAPAWLGDMVMAQALVQVLADGDGGPVDVVAPRATLALAERMPGVREAMLLDVAHGELVLGRRRALGRALRGRGYGVAWVLPNSFKSALVPWFAGIPRRVGWVGEARRLLLTEARRLDPSALPTMVQRFVGLARSTGTDAVRPRLEARPLSAARRAQLELDVAERRVALCPGAAFGPAKRWPVERFAALGRSLIALGFAVCVVGGAEERPLGERIAAACADRRCVDLTGRTTLGEAVDILADCAAVVSNDSGLMHVAAAVARPLVAVYGSSTPAFTPPLAPWYRVAAAELPCRPCFARVCPLGHTRCLSEVSADAVLDMTRLAVMANGDGAR